MATAVLDRRRLPRFATLRGRRPRGRRRGLRRRPQALQRDDRPQAAADRPRDRRRRTSPQPCCSRARRGLPFAIKGGGHGVNGHAVCDDGIMLDLSLMKKITVDPIARTVTAEAGVNWGEFDAATQAARSRDDRRPRDDDRHRRADARHRQRLARAAPRLHRRQSHLGGRRHGRRTTRPRERGRERRPLLGTSRRRRQLRRRRELRVPAARVAAAHARRDAALAVRPSRRGHPPLPRVHRRTHPTRSAVRSRS